LNRRGVQTFYLAETDFPGRRTMRHLVGMIRNNSLCLLLLALFVACIGGHSYAGWRFENDTLSAHGHGTVGYAQFVLSGTFWEQLSANWQAAILQLASLIVLSSFLYQRGAPHSRDPRKRKKKARRLRRGLAEWLYRHSLSLAFFALFVAALIVHILAGAAAYNHERGLAGQTPIAVADYLVSAQFWASTLETWQAEYLVIALYLVLSIFLREEGSAESKPIEARKATTGEANK
jgi:Domain of unknown function (DUF6766)